MQLAKLQAMKQPDLLGPPPPRPSQITTNSPDEFFAVVDRQANGELVIDALAVGKGNGQWVISIHYEH